MNNEQLISSIAEFAASKGIDRPAVIRMLRDVLQSLIEKKFGAENNFDIVIDAKKGDLQIWRSRFIVADESEEVGQHNRISLSEARKIEKDFEIGEEVVTEVELDIFGRRAVVDALNLFMRKKEDLEKEQLYEQYSRLVGKIISVEVGYCSRSCVVLYDDNKNELLLPRSAQIPQERFRKGSYIKALIEKVEQKNGKVNVLLSRISPLFLEELLTVEIPEIFEKIVLVKAIARIPGVRSKVIVESQDDRVDAAGACIGPNGRRIQAISKEHLNGERIDIITYSINRNLFIRRILGISTPIEVQEKDEGLFIYGKSSQMALLQQGLPFLKQILGIKVYILNSNVNEREEEDVYLDEFTNEITPEIIDAIKKAGLNTAKSVLNTSKEALITKTGLDKATLDAVCKILVKEFTI